jgi:hypothetical protein
MQVKMSWLHTRVPWSPIKFDSGLEGRAALFPHRKQRLPWAPHLERLLVVICNHELGIYKYDTIPSHPLPYADAIFLTKVVALTSLQEWFEWPCTEAIYDGQSAGEDIVEGLPTPCLTQALLKEWHKKSFVAGWWPTNRGAIGLSFLRNLQDGQRCVEIRAQSRVLVYRGTLAQNEALYDHRIVKAFGLHAVDQMQGFVSDPDYTSCRELLRRLRVFCWGYALEQDLPF